MLPKIASALARVLAPIKPIARPGEAVIFQKSAEGGEGGHGALSYSKQEDAERHASAEPPSSEADQERPQPTSPHGPDSDPEPETNSLLQKKGPSLPLQPGLTQVILDLSSKRQEMVSGPTSPSNVVSYEVGAKEQKKASRLPKGSMLDKKVG